MEWFEILSRTHQFYPSNGGDRRIYFKDLFNLSRNFKHGLVLHVYGYYPVPQTLSVKAYINGKTYPFTEAPLRNPRAVLDKKENYHCILKIPSKLMLGLETMSSLLQDKNYIYLHYDEPTSRYAFLFEWRVHCLLNDDHEIETAASFMVISQRTAWHFYPALTKQVNQYPEFFPGVRNMPGHNYGGLIPYDSQGSTFSPIMGAATYYFWLGQHAKPSFHSNKHSLDKVDLLVKFYYDNFLGFSHNAQDMTVPFDCYEGVFLSLDSGCLINPDRIKKKAVKTQSDRKVTVEHFFNLQEKFALLTPFHFNEGLWMKVIDQLEEDEVHATHYYSFFNPTSQKVFVKEHVNRPIKMEKNQVYDWTTRTLITCENNNSFAKVGLDDIVIQLNDQQSIGLTPTSVVTIAELFPSQISVTSKTIDVPVWELLKVKHHLEAWSQADEFYLYHYTAGQEAKEMSYVQNEDLGRVFYYKSSQKFDDDNKLNPGTLVTVTREELIGNPQAKVPPSLYYRWGPGAEIIGVAPKRPTHDTGGISCADIHFVILQGPPIPGYSKPYNY